MSSRSPLLETADRSKSPDQAPEANQEDEGSDLMSSFGQSRTHDEALRKLFHQLLRTLAELDIFCHLDSPSIFIIYAHENSKAGTAHADVVQFLIHSLLEIRATAYSDRSPRLLMYTREDGDAATQNIVSNQFCLLPADGGDENRDVIKSVDKVVLCGSEVLKTYYETSFSSSYMKLFTDLYTRAQDDNTPREKLREEIFTIVHKNCQEDDFHHVLTEIAFLHLRHSKLKNADHGIIPISLEGDLMQYLPFFRPTDIVNKRRITTKLGDLHHFFFNLLEHLYAHEKPVITKFRQGYDQASQLLLRDWKDEHQVTSIIQNEISKAVKACTEDGVALFRQTDRRLGALAHNRRDIAEKYNLGLNLFNAPVILDGLFVGRGAEIQKMENVLQPKSSSQTRRAVSLVGMGGIGKTQLAIRYATTHRSSYTSIFWLTANSKEELETSLLRLTPRIFPGEVIQNAKDETLTKVLNWFSEPENSRWLIIFDNYDNPEKFKISDYYPAVLQGSIIVTTRQSNLVSTLEVEVKSLTNLEESLDILVTRSGRQDARSDPTARQLADRFKGHPLALATAGAYLSQSSITFGAYLQRYEAKWKITESMQALPDYPSRTLYTTWNMSYDQIQQQNVRAANLLKFLAYLNHKNIWHGLFHRIKTEDQPAWFTELADDEFVFEDAVHMLVRYCLIEPQFQTQSYTMHTCIHDWALGGLNSQINLDHYWLVVDCIFANIADIDPEELSGFCHQDVVAHGERLLHAAFRKPVSKCGWSPIQFARMRYITFFLQQQLQFKAAEDMCLWLLEIYEEFPVSCSSLDFNRIITDLGIMYEQQGKLEEAERMFRKVLERPELSGPESLSTFDSFNNLGILYQRRDKLEQAEEMFQRALAGLEELFGPDHIGTLKIANNLGKLYFKQRRLDEAEGLLQRVLAGYQKSQTVNAVTTLDVVNDLQFIHMFQGKLPVSADIIDGIFNERIKMTGRTPLEIIHSFNAMGLALSMLHQLDEAEKYFQLALIEYDNIFGPNNIHSLKVVSSLGSLFYDQNRFKDAEKMFHRLVPGRERIYGSDHPNTLEAVSMLNEVKSANQTVEQHETRDGLTNTVIQQNPSNEPSEGHIESKDLSLSRLMELIPVPSTTTNESVSHPVDI